MPRWSKITEYIGQDAKLAELAEKNPLAALFFTWCIPVADLYGILPGEPREYRARVASAMMTDTATVQQAIDDQVEAGFLHAYEDNGKPLLYVCQYHKHQTVNWFKVKASQHALPESWEIPPELEEHIESGALKQANKGWGTHGIEGSLGSRRKQTPSASSKTEESKIGGIQDKIGSSGEQTPSADTETIQPSAASRPKQDVDVDTDIDIDKGNDSLAEASTEPPAPTPTLQQQLEQLRDGIPTDHLALVDEFLGLCASDNKSGEIGMSRRVNETRRLTELRAELGGDPWAYGMDAACRKGAPNLNYVKKAAGSWGQEALPARRLKGVHPPGDFSNVKTNKYGEVID